MLKFETLVEVLCAAHLTRYVESPYKARGGVLLVGPPGVMKSTLLNSLEVYPDAIVLTDINTQSLNSLRDSITSNSIATLAVSDLQKVYERNPQVSSNVEGSIRALVEEGYKGAAHEDSRINRLTARCMVMGGVTPAFAANQFKHWMDSGFLRRFLYVLYRLDDPDALARAVEEWKLIDIGLNTIPAPMGMERSIPDCLTVAERQKIRSLLKYQYGDTLPLQLMCKIGCVLRWHFKRHCIRREPMHVLDEFAQCLTRDGATVELKEKGKKANAKRKK